MMEVHSRTPPYQPDQGSAGSHFISFVAYMLRFTLPGKQSREKEGDADYFVLIVGA